MKNGVVRQFLSFIVSTISSISTGLSDTCASSFADLNLSALAQPFCDTIGG